MTGRGGAWEASVPGGRLWEMRVGCVGEGEGVVDGWWRTLEPRISIDFRHAADAVLAEAVDAVEAARGRGVGPLRSRSWWCR